jgi:site-specific DNA recombinase
MIRAAVYARRSKEQDDVENDAKSVNRQVENARVFATAKGWTVLEEHVYVDDGISGGSSLAKLEGKARLLDAITHSKAAPFEALICQAPDRFSRRDGDEAFAELKAISKRGVQVWFYSDGTRFRYGTFESNISGFLKGEFAAEYRRTVSQKTTESHLRKAKLGHLIGGRRFGYSNVTVEKHGDLVVNGEERPIVVRMFELCATGTGYTRIAKTLNAEGARCPRPQQGRPAGWSPSTVRSILHNELYRGVLVTFKTKKRDESGDVAPTRRPESEWVRVIREDLRIVSEEQWEAAHARLRRTRTTMNTEAGRRKVARRDYDSKYLLTGFGRCTTCGGSIAVVSRRTQGRRRLYFYGCLANWKRGAAICPNDLILPIDRVNDAVLKAIAGDVLRPAVVSAIIDGFLEQLVPANVESRVDDLRRQLRGLDTKIQNLTAAVEQGGANLPSVIALLGDRQKERDGLVAEIASADTLHQIHVDRASIEAKVQKSVQEWRTLLGGSVTDGRQLLREVLEAPLKFEADGKTYRFSAPVATGTLIAGAVLPTRMASPPGFEPGFQP